MVRILSQRAEIVVIIQSKKHPRKSVNLRMLRAQTLYCHLIVAFYRTFEQVQSHSRGIGILSATYTVNRVGECYVTIDTFGAA